MDISDYTDQLCPICLSRKDSSGVCPKCGHSPSYIQSAPFLPLGTLLSGRYIIGRERSENGDGITYIAYDLSVSRRVCVREFFPAGLARRADDGVSVDFPAAKVDICRDCGDSFISLWRKLKELRGLSALISVTDVFEEGGTAYAVYDNTEETTLRDYLLRSDTGYIGWDQARILFMPVLQTLGTLHTNGIIHRGISPVTLFIGADGKIKISGFSIWQARCANGELDAELFPGYAAIEQYVLDYQHGPWTDIYSFAAVLYRALIGSQPIDAPSRAENDRLMIPAKFAEQLPAYVINSLVNALQIIPDERTRSIEQFRCELSASPQAVEAEPAVQSRAYVPAVDSDSVKIFTPGAPVEPRTESDIRDQYRDLDRSVDVTPAPAEDAPIVNKTKKKHTGLTTALIVCLCCVLVGAGSFLFFDRKQLFGGSSSGAATTVSGQQVTVPNFVGVAYSTISGDKSYTSRFNFDVSYAPSSSVEKGCIISQNVDANTRVAQGSTIGLVVSSGPETFDMPDVSGMTYNDAYSYLVSKSLKVEKSTKYNDGSHIGGTVAETLPAAGTSVSPGDTVKVIVWTEADTTTTAAPVSENDVTTVRAKDESASAGAAND